MCLCLGVFCLVALDSAFLVGSLPHCAFCHYLHYSQCFISVKLYSFTFKIWRYFTIIKIHENQKNNCLVAGIGITAMAKFGDSQFRLSSWKQGIVASWFYRPELWELLKQHLHNLPKDWPFGVVDQRSPDKYVRASLSFVFLRQNVTNHKTQTGTRNPRLHEYSSIWCRGSQQFWSTRLLWYVQ